MSPRCSKRSSRPPAKNLFENSWRGLSAEYALTPGGKFHPRGGDACHVTGLSVTARLGVRTFHESPDFVATFVRTWTPPRKPHVLGSVATSTLEIRCDCIIPTEACDVVSEIPTTAYLLPTSTRRVSGHCSRKANHRLRGFSSQISDLKFEI